jgi:hypothetical protein
VDRQNKTDRTRAAKQERKNVIGRIGQAYRTGKTGQAEQDRQNRTGRTGQREWVRQNETGRTGKAEREGRTGKTEQGRQTGDRTV